MHWFIKNEGTPVITLAPHVMCSFFLVNFYRDVTGESVSSFHVLMSEFCVNDQPVSNRIREKMMIAFWCRKLRAQK